MVIDLSEVVKHFGSVSAFDGQITAEPFMFASTMIRFAGPISLEGTVTNAGNVLRLCVHARAALDTRCARCGRNIRVDVCADIDESLVSAHRAEQLTEEDEVIVFSGFRFCLDDIVLNSLVGELPIRFLCRPDCKGLCQQCGQDLNEGQCSCSTEAIDPRLAVLSKLYDKSRQDDDDR